MTYIGQTVPQTFLDRWHSGNHVGAAKPVVKVEYRKGQFHRRYHTGTEWTKTGDRGARQNSLFGWVAGEGNAYWYPDWKADTDWTEIGEVYDVRLNQDFTQNGITTATIIVDNTILNPATGVAGSFHQVAEGWWTPLRGYAAPGQAPPPQAKNSNFQKLPDAQIRVWGGYGDNTLVVLFLGLIDSLDIEGGSGGGGGSGAQVTLTCRDFGGVLQDEHIFAWNVDPIQQAPVKFVPRSVAEGTVKVGGGAFASSETPGHPARSVVDTEAGTTWESQDSPVQNPTSVEWIDITLPGGSYNSVYVTPEFDGQDLYVSIFARVRHGMIRNRPQFVPPLWTSDVDQLNSKILGPKDLTHTEYQTDPYSGLKFAEGWVDIWGAKQIVPGSNNIPYAIVARNTDGGKGRTLYFGGEYNLGHNSKIRISVRKQGIVQHHPPVYRAGLTRLAANQRQLLASTAKPHWIIVDDVAQIVETVLRFAGFKSWEVETTGVNLKTPYVADKAKSYRDVIQDVQDQTGYVFFIAEPKSDTNDLDIGCPVFRQSRLMATRQQGYIEAITDDKLLTGSRINYNNVDERYVIRVRGGMLKRSQGGRQLQGDPNFRAMFVYFPPWASRMSGVLKQFTHYDAHYLSNNDCQIAAYIIALQIALADVTFVINTAATPSIGLDSFMKIVDRSSGTASRGYVTNRQLQFTAGEQAKFISSFGGAIVDTPDVINIVQTYQSAARTMDVNDGPATTHPFKPRGKHTHTPKATPVSTGKTGSGATLAL